MKINMKLKMKKIIKFIMNRNNCKRKIENENKHQKKAIKYKSKSE